MKWVTLEFKTQGDCINATMINPFVKLTLYILETTASVKARPARPGAAAVFKTDATSMGELEKVQVPVDNGVPEKNV